MKKIGSKVILFCLALIATSCGSCSSQKQKTAESSEIPAVRGAATAEATLIQGYFLKNTYTFDGDMAFFVFGDQASFDNYMGAGRTMSNNPSVPSFTKNVVAAIASRPTDIKTAISVTRVEMQGDKAAVHFEVTPGEKIGYTMTPQILFSFPKTEGLKTVEFVTGGKTVKTIVLDRRSAGAPKDVSDLKKNFMGTYAGTLPCADCGGIETELTLNPDYTYRLSRIYKGKGDGKPVIENGKWTVSEDLAFIELNYDGGEKTCFALIDGRTVEKLDNQAMPVKSGANYRLVKK